MSPPDTESPTAEEGINLDLEGQLTYGDYLCLNQLLTAQKPRVQPPHHDEMLFIIQHQVAELWMKLLLHELRAAIKYIQHDDLDPCLKIMARVKQIQQQLFSQWSVLETLTPYEYARIRNSLGSASGFQSLQYRAIEFILGNKQPQLMELFQHDPSAHQRMCRILEAPSLYDEFLRHLHRAGHDIPEECINRDWSSNHTSNAAVVQAFKKIYTTPAQYWNAYAFCETLVDLEERFQLWRFRHLKTVERIIGSQRGTGGSSGVGYLKRALEITFFPELYDVRTELYGS